MENMLYQDSFSEKQCGHPLGYKIALFYLIVFGVQFVHFEGYGPSLFKAGAMIIAPLLFIASKTAYSVAWLGAIVYYSLLLLSLIIRGLSVTSLTVGYTLGCLCAFSTFHSLLVSGVFTKLDAEKILKGFIFVYTGVMLLQQVKRFTGIGYAPVINYWSIVMGSTHKFNSLFIEPSHFGRVMAVVLFAYLELKRLDYDRKLSLKELWKNDRWVMSAGIYSLIFSGSGAAIVSLGIVIGYLLCNGNLHFVIFALILMLVVSPFLSEIDQVKRTVSVLEATTTMNAAAVQKVDNSAAARTSVFFAAIENFRPWADDFWIGQTPGSREYHPNLGIIELYGALAYCGLLFLLFKCCFRSLISIEIVFFCGLFAATVGNVAYIWFSMMVLAIVKYFYDKQGNRNDQLPFSAAH